MKPILNIIYLLFILSFFQTVNAQTHVSGLISGQTWTKSGSPYIVDSNIFVATLIIEPGTIITFSGDFKFEIGGILTAIGNKCDSIRFTQDDSLSGWDGVFFNYSTPGSELAYCIIEKSDFHGLIIDHSAPIIRNSSIKDNHYSNNGDARGAGIYGLGTVVIDSCLISNNSVSAGGSNFTAQTSYGAGIFVNGDLTMNGCVITGDTARSNACYATGYAYGSGVAVIGTLNLNNCIVTENYSNGGGYSGGLCNGRGYGGGIYVNGKALLNNSVISYNTVYGFNQRYAGGVFITNQDSSKIINCTIAYNSHEGLWGDLDTVLVRNSILYFNVVSQIAGKASVSYSNVQNGYSGVGNINSNPVFKSTSCLEIVLGSACVDAGDSSSFYNDVCMDYSLGTVRNDIGAHGGPSSCNWKDATLLPLSYVFTVVHNTTIGGNNGSITLNIKGCYPAGFFSWTGPSGFSSNNQNIGNLLSGWYYLFYGDTSCQHVDSILITDGPLGTGHPSENLLIKCSPNPFVNQITIAAPKGIYMKRINIVSVLGQRVTEKLLSPGENEYIWSGLDDVGMEVIPGMYFVLVDSGNKEYIQRVVKQ